MARFRPQFKIWEGARGGRPGPRPMPPHVRPREAPAHPSRASHLMFARGSRPLLLSLSFPGRAAARAPTGGEGKTHIAWCGADPGSALIHVPVRLGPGSAAHRTRSTSSPQWSSSARVLHRARDTSIVRAATPSVFSRVSNAIALPPPEPPIDVTTNPGGAALGGGHARIRLSLSRVDFQVTLATVLQQRVGSAGM